MSETQARLMAQPSNRRVEDVRRHRLAMVGIRRHPVGALVDRSQRLPLQAAAHPLRTHLQALLAQPANDARTPIAAFARRVQCRHLRIQPRIGLRPGARRTPPPLQIARARHHQQSAHPADRVIVAMLLDPGVPHRDSFAKYAAAFFTISRSSLALASSRRSRAFSASTSETGRLTGPPRPRPEPTSLRDSAEPSSSWSTAESPAAWPPHCHPSTVPT